MLYQTMMLGKNPYYVAAGKLVYCQQHRHPELELSFCLSGSYRIIIEKKEYFLREGDLAIVNSMEAHEFPDPAGTPGRMLTIEVGPKLLLEYFDPFSKVKLPIPVFHLKDIDGHPVYPQLLQMLTETAALKCSGSDFSELSIKGNLYRISALLLQHLISENAESTSLKRLQDVAKMEKALEIMQEKFDTMLDIDYVSRVCGYSKSSFCKAFKSITGETFHSALNRHRVEMAKLQLRQTKLPVEDIAVRTGFADAKSFCRVFKNITGSTPGDFRRQS